MDERPLSKMTSSDTMAGGVVSMDEPPLSKSTSSYTMAGGMVGMDEPPLSHTTSSDIMGGGMVGMDEPSLSKKASSAAMAERPLSKMISSDAMSEHPLSKMISSEPMAEPSLPKMASSDAMTIFSDAMSELPLSKMASSDAMAERPLSKMISSDAMSEYPLSKMASTDAMTEPSLSKMISSDAMSGYPLLKMASRDAMAEPPLSKMISSDTMAEPPLPNMASSDAMAEHPLSKMTSSDTMAFMANLATSAFVDPPGLPFSADSPRESYANPTLNESGTLLGAKSEKLVEEPILPAPATSAKSRRRVIIIALLLIALVLVAAAVVVPVYFTVIKPKLDASVKNKPSSSSGGSSTGSSGPTSTAPSGSKPSGVSNPITGGDGSTVYTANGTTFTYHNSFGGFWYYDPSNPFVNNAQPNTWTPPLNQTWDFAAHRINGVNLGGWFVLEPFITPALFQKYPGAVDEWTLSTMMAADTSPGGGLGQLEDHYNTFITEQDIAEIAAAGLNWVRIPIPFWAIDVWEGEPFLARTSWKYIVQAFQWCRKYGIRVNLDLHTIPGSQNGYNHSGKAGQIDFLHGVMGMANAQRTMNYIRIITEFISQDEWKDVVIIFGIVNEAIITTIGTTQLRAFYVEAYETMRGITGLGAGNGPYMSIHDGFQGLQGWPGFLTGADRLMIDTHPYIAFNGQPNTDPIDTGTGAGAGGKWPKTACQQWASPMNASRIGFGTTIAGEYSNGINDCGLYLLGVGVPATYPGNCAEWQDASQWDAGTIAGILQFALASMDALGDSFFWTWKVSPSNAGIVESPLWSYQLGLQGGWMPTDPRVAVGACGAPAGPIFTAFLPWMTGGAGAGAIGPAQTQQYPYPPVELEDTPYSATLLPSYTSTGPISTLPPPTYTSTNGAAINAGDGWFNAQDNLAAPTPIPGCAYPNAWDALDAPLPAAVVCGGAA